MNSNPGKSTVDDQGEFGLAGGSGNVSVENTSVYNEQEKQWGRPVRHRALIGILAALAGLYFLDTVYKIATRPDMYGWDFKTAYWAGKTNAAGLNPYGVTALGRVAQQEIRLRWRYPPAMLWFYQLFGLFPYPIAHMLFLALKCALLALLFWCWTKSFLRREYDALFFVFALFAFNSSICVDLMSGNISLVEQAGLWLALAFFLRRRYLLFTVLLVLVSGIKFAPLFFLVLLLFVDHRRKTAYFFGGALAFTAIQVVFYAAWPLFHEFLIMGPQVQADFGEGGYENPSSYSLLGELVRAIKPHWHHGGQWRLHMVFFMLLAGLILALSGKAARRLAAASGLDAGERDRLLVSLACLTYALIVPRFMAYSQMILIAPAYFILRRVLDRNGGALLFMVLAGLQSRGYATLPGLNAVFEYIWTYFELFLAAFLWFVLVRGIVRAGRNGAGRISLLAHTPAPG